MIRALVFAVALLATGPLYAVQCGSPVYHRPQTYSNNYVAQPTYAHVDYPPQVINQTIFYEVGRDVRYPTVTPQAVAAAEVGQLAREAQRIQDKMQDLLQYQKQLQQPQVVYMMPPAQQPMPAQPQPQPTPAQPAPTQPAQPTPAQPERPTFSMTKPASVIEAKCIQCHGKNGVIKGDLDLTKTITCLQFVEAYKRMVSDDPTVRMPFKLPGLTGDEVKVALDELTAMVGNPQAQDASAKQQFAESIAGMIDPTKAK